jgi:hypothetical protein
MTAEEQEADAKGCYELAMKEIGDKSEGNRHHPGVPVRGWGTLSETESGTGEPRPAQPRPAQSCQ